jgi:hypothetical protein
MKKKEKAALTVVVPGPLLVAAADELAKTL